MKPNQNLFYIRISYLEELNLSGVEPAALSHKKNQRPGYHGAVLREIVLLKENAISRAVDGWNNLRIRGDLPAVD